MRVLSLLIIIIPTASAVYAEVIYDYQTYSYDHILGLGCIGPEG